MPIGFVGDMNRTRGFGVPPQKRKGVFSLSDAGEDGHSIPNTARKVNSSFAFFFVCGS
jgi:hypothetical protein